MLFADSLNLHFHIQTQLFQTGEQVAVRRRRQISNDTFSYLRSDIVDSGDLLCIGSQQILDRTKMHCQQPSHLGPDVTDAQAEKQPVEALLLAGGNSFH